MAKSITQKKHEDNINNNIDPSATKNSTLQTTTQSPQTSIPRTLPHSSDGFSCELNYLTYMFKLDNDEDRDTIWNQLRGDGAFKGGEVVYTDEQKDLRKTRVTNFKGNTINGNKPLPNYYADKVYDKLPSSANPYIIAEADFAYLTNLGVYPLNRMWVLRRFQEGNTVPDNLLDWGGEKEPPQPISTVVGWINPDDENFFNVSFNEEWVVTNSRVDEVLSEMLDKEFHFKTEAVASIPGWSQGLLMGFLKKMGMTNFDSTHIPMGNPDVLQQAATRLTDPNSTSYGLKSDVSFDLKTSYEQKFIGEIDPGSAMLDILRNLTRMGSSDVIYFSHDNDFFKSIREASHQGNDASLWGKVILTLITNFVEAIGELFDDMSSSLGKEAPKKTTLTQGKNESKEDFDKRKEDDRNKNKSELGKATAEKSLMTSTLNTVKGLIDTVLGSTAAKWKWPLKGGMGVMTGENTTPWHLTIGNPTSPFVSLGNVIVSNINVDFKNELGFNDIPNKIDITIKLKQGRDMGAQEIFAMFNNGYTRVYDIDTKKQLSVANYYKKPGNKIEKGKGISTAQKKPGQNVNK